jgi:hypothetical protein
MLIADCSISFLPDYFQGIWGRKMKRHRYHSCFRSTNENHTWLEKITRSNATITQNSGLFPLNYGKLAVNMRVINFST